MPNRIRAMIFCFFVGALLAWLIFALMGCAGVEIKGECRHETDYAMHVFGEQYPVRAVIGVRYLYGFHGDHSIAQALIEGKWQNLCVDYPRVFTCPPDPSLTPEVYLPPWAWKIHVRDFNQKVK